MRTFLLRRERGLVEDLREVIMTMTVARNDEHRLGVNLKWFDVSPS